MLKAAVTHSNQYPYTCFDLYLSICFCCTEKRMLSSVQYTICSLLFHLLFEIKAVVQHFGKEAYSLPGDFAAGWLARNNPECSYIYNSVNWSLTRASTSLFVKSARAE